MRRIGKACVAGLAFLVAVSGTGAGLSRFVGRERFTPVFQKGMCYTTWSKNAYNTKKSADSLKRLRDINVTWVAILSTWYQDHCFATKIFPTGKTPSDESVTKAITDAHALGLKVVLKPHLDLISTEYGGWRGEITCTSEPDWDRWFASYRDFILHYAKMAQKQGVEMYCIGTELTEATTHTAQWKELIRAVRAVYKGDLTYAANWSDEYLHIRFWDDLDYAGIDAYFPLANKDKPTYEELMEAWIPWAGEIEQWQKTVNKPVIFPEVGYRSSLGTARQPWEHVPGPKVDVELQKECYRAMVDTFWNKEWFYGVYWWNWGTDKRMGGKHNRGFTPQNKPVEGYVAALYAQRVNK
jgi:hypothetical protein